MPWGIAGAVVAVIGAAVSAAGQMQQASAAKASADYQSKVALGNQETAMQNAQFAAASGEQQAAVQQQKTRSQLGSILSGQASSGVDVNSQTSKGVRASEDEFGALDASTIKSNAIRQAYGFETQSTNFGNSASADTAQGKNDETGGEFSATGGLLSGVGNAGLNYSKAIGAGSGIDSSNSINDGGFGAGSGGTGVGSGTGGLY